MKKCLLSIFAFWAVSISFFVFAESYQNSDWYKDYLNLPDKYKTPEMEKQFREGYEAESKVKRLPCTQGGTVAGFLDKKASIPAVEDLGWIVTPYNGGFEVERLMLLKGTMKLKYYWRVNSDGTIIPKNGKAISITK